MQKKSISNFPLVNCHRAIAELRGQLCKQPQAEEARTRLSEKPLPPPPQKGHTLQERVPEMFRKHVSSPCATDLKSLVLQGRSNAALSGARHGRVGWGCVQAMVNHQPQTRNNIPLHIRQSHGTATSRFPSTTRGERNKTQGSCEDMSADPPCPAIAEGIQSRCNHETKPRSRFAMLPVQEEHLVGPQLSLINDP